MTNKFFFKNKEINENSKKAIVNEVFDIAAKKYDIMNDFMSLFLHRIWKKKLIEYIHFEKDKKYNILDMAAGTCDISLLIINKIIDIYGRDKYLENFKLYIADINNKMLELGKKRIVNSNLYSSNIYFDIKNACLLDYKDNMFDYYIISFGIRNVENIDLALQEARRILKKNGKLIIMEFASDIENETSSIPKIISLQPYFKKIYNLYLDNIIPFLGDKIAKDKDAYIYLSESIKRFPSKKEMVNKISRSGFENIEYKLLSNSAVTIFLAN